MHKRLSERTWSESICQRCRPSQKRVYAALVRKTSSSESAEPIRLCGRKDIPGSANRRCTTHTSSDQVTTHSTGCMMRLSTRERGVCHMI